MIEELDSDTSEVVGDGLDILLFAGLLGGLDLLAFSGGREESGHIPGTVVVVEFDFSTSSLHPGKIPRYLIGSTLTALGQLYISLSSCFSLSLLFLFFVLFISTGFEMPRLLSRDSSFSVPDSFAPLATRPSTAPPKTPRPATTATSIASQDIVCAVSGSRGVSSTVGLAFVNLSTAEAVLCQICDSQTYVKTITKIAVFEPTEILFMSTAKDSNLYYIIQENASGPTLTFQDRRYWSEKTGHEYVDRLAFPEDAESIKVTLGGNYFAACSFAAVRPIMPMLGETDSSRSSNTWNWN